MITKHKDNLIGTKNEVTTDAYTSTRLLLREDGLGLTVTDVYLTAGTERIYYYPNHLEIAYCLEGSATLENLENQQVHQVTKGFLWATTKERFKFTVYETVRLICVFNPALVGIEVNDENGAFPLLP